MKFSRQFLQDRLEDDEGLISDEICGTRRWSTDHWRIFRHEGNIYGTNYSVGSTEQQDERPYEFDAAEIECPELVAVEKTVTVYEVKK